MAEFRQQHQDLHGPELRSPLALALVDSLRSAISQPEVPLDIWQLRTKTQIDAVEWLAWNELWYYANHVEIRASKEAEPKRIRHEEFNAKERLFDDIEIYGMLSGVTDGSEAYHELLAAFYQARLIVKNPSGLAETGTAIDAVALAQQLAVHRTVKALHYGGFTKTRRSSQAEKDKKTDVVIPIGQSEKRTINIRMQPGSSRSGKVGIQPVGLSTRTMSEYLFVDIPYYPEKHSPFVMADTDRLTLCESAKQMRGRLLTFSPRIRSKL
ncbi:hypothetical protein KW794_01205 [Candidatus Saccharibacteria bacterium]|nr:hypothetical protein [Candidatus Saccharibacteria bacterium]